MTETVTHKKKARSPSYPAIGLQEAIEKAKILHQQDGRNPAPVSTILDHWSYAPGSGPGVTAIAALRKFGLLDYDGSGASRQGRLTDLALKIILDDRDPSPDREAAIREAALTPTIHAEVLQKFPDEFPSDGNLKHYLTYERKFTAGAAKLLIEELKDTLAFAGIMPGGSVSPNESNSESKSPVTPPTAVLPVQPQGADARSLQVPLPGGGVATLATSRPLTEAEWTTLTTVVTAMKPSFLESDPWVGTDGPDED